MLIEDANDIFARQYFVDYDGTVAHKVRILIIDFLLFSFYSLGDGPLMLYPTNQKQII